MLRQLRAEQKESDWQHSAALPQQQYWLLLPCSGALRQQHTTLAPGACSQPVPPGLIALPWPGHCSMRQHQQSSVITTAIVFYARLFQ